MTVKVSQYFGFFAFLMAIVCPLSGCSDDDSTPGEAAQDIHFNVDVWRMFEATRANFYTTGTDGLKSNGFNCAAYIGSTPYFSTLVTWNDSKWGFKDGKHFWPTSGTVTFYGYSTEPSCFGTSHTHASGIPQFTCTNLPMTSDGSSDVTNDNDQDDLWEFVYAKATGTKAENGETGVTLNFQHPFTRINLKFSSTQGSIHINTITFKSLKNNGNFNDGTWTLTGEATNFVVTANSDYSAGNDIGSYLMIPQSWAGEIEVEATWTDWGEQFAHTVSTKLDAITWQAGYSYTYTFTVTETDLKVDTSKFTEQW